MSTLQFFRGSVSVVLMYVLLLSVGTACGKGKTSEISLEGRYYVPIRELAAEPMTAVGELRRPGALVGVGRDVVVFEEGDSQLDFRMFDSETGKAKSRWHVHPSSADVHRVWTLQRDSSKGRPLVTAYLLETRELIQIDVKASVAADSTVLLKTIHLKAPSTTTSPTTLRNGNFLSPGFYTAGRFAEFGNDGEFLGYRGKEPSGSAGDSSIATEVRQHAFQSRAAANQRRGRIALASFYMDRLDIFDETGALVKEGERPFAFEVPYHAARSGSRSMFVSDRGTRFAYFSVDSDDGHIYALFSGRAAGSPFGSAGRWVHVFDWEGRLVEVLQLSVDAQAIAVADNGRFLFATNADQDTRLWRYTLPREYAGSGATR